MGTPAPADNASGALVHTLDNFGRNVPPEKKWGGNEGLRQLSRCAGTSLLLIWAAGAVASPLGEHPDERVQQLWAEGLALERREEPQAFLESSRRYERIAERLPESAFIRWRLSRNYWRYGERLPLDDKRQRLHFFELATRWADRGIEVDERCGECFFWKAASLGRLATTRGVVQAAGSASTIAKLLERGIELRPTHVDGPQNHTLGNLYYAASAFYRVVPDWWWLSLVLGVRGDNHRALAYIEKAIEISSQRLDYQVERGAVLLCIGHEEDDAERIEEGRRVLRESLKLQDFQKTDSFDREHARILIDDPSRSCGYSRDGWVDLEEAAKRS